MQRCIFGRVTRQDSETIFVTVKFHTHDMARYFFGMSQRQGNVSHCTTEVYLHTRVDEEFALIIRTNHHVNTKRSTIDIMDSRLDLFDDSIANLQQFR